VSDHVSSVSSLIFVTSGYFDFSILQSAVSFFKS
jgi:hypothetical protein